MVRVLPDAMVSPPLPTTTEAVVLLIERLAKVIVPEIVCVVPAVPLKLTVVFVDVNVLLLAPKVKLPVIFKLQLFEVSNEAAPDAQPCMVTFPTEIVGV